MIDKLRSNTNTAYLMFVMDLSDPSSIDKDDLVSKMKCPLLEMMDSQKNADRTKNKLGHENFNKLLSLYFSEFQSPDGINYRLLMDKIKQHEPVFNRHLGKWRLQYLKLLLNTLNAIEVNRRGLLCIAR